ncbi:MAG: hypothetical protein IJ242_17805 [Clostridia bacterium]|nr:hypothetical protein [Clostridia bacterium]
MRRNWTTVNENGETHHEKNQAFFTEARTVRSAGMLVGRECIGGKIGIGFCGDRPACAIRNGGRGERGNRSGA